MRIELLRTPGCPRCALAAADLRSAAAAVLGDALVWSELDITKHLDYAVELGAASSPAIAIDGELFSAGLPSPAELEAEIHRRRGVAQAKT